MYKEKSYLLKINFICEYDNIEQTISTIEFTEPTIEHIEDVLTPKQVLYFLSEIFGDSIYDYIDQEVLNIIEETPVEDILEILIICLDDEISYSIDINKGNIEIS